MTENLLVANKAGTLGKSTIASIVIAPRFGCDEVIAIETENAAGTRYAEKVKHFTADLYSDYAAHVMETNDAGRRTVTDLGSSNYVRFVDNLRLAGGIALIDYLVVITDTQERSQTDAVETIRAFYNYGLDPSKVRVVLNKASLPSPTMPIERQYDTLFAAARVDPRIKLNANCWMPSLSIYDHMVFNGIRWHELMADTTDHAAALRATIADGATLERAKTVAFRLARMGRDAAINFADRLYAELSIGDPVQLLKNTPKVDNPPATAPADTKSDTSRPNTAEKAPTVKA
ncbi:hypothetical protein AB4Y32_30620 [Paraburkholderia phymatum]|uniref:Uncharacterized protein n=1 Tax=Paraburkholderia phymatum TaxID=148447 RepID=A0ACC6U953_9BURK